jgi:4'-phosphopantetheinyl transferase
MTEVFIQYINFKNQSFNLNKIISVLPDLIQNRINEYGKETDKLRSALGYWLLKSMLIHNFNCAEDVLNQLQFEEKGKPVLAKNIFCSLSHSGDYVVVAVSKQNIGIDIEKHRDNTIKLFEKYFDLSEKEILGVDLKTSFFNGWVIKEATTKYHGEGIGILSKIKIIDSSIVRLIDENLQYKLLDIDDDYSVGIVSKNIVKTTISTSLLQSC